MIGIPTESLNDINKTVSLAAKLMKDSKGKAIPIFSMFAPYPNTEVFQLCKEKFDFNEPKNIYEWSKFNKEDMNSC